MNGKHEVSRVQLDPALLSDDKEMLEDLVAAAITMRLARSKRSRKRKCKVQMAGMQLPPGMKLPF